MANDVSGWSARAVEFSRLISFFQNVRHPQPEMGRTFSLRDMETHRRVNTPFDKVAHTVDVRAMQALPGVGWYHPKKVGLFRLASKDSVSHDGLPMSDVLQTGRSC